MSSTRIEPQVIEFKQSSGAEAQRGQLLTVQYAAALSLEDLEKGEYIDRSFERRPIKFVLGAGEVLRGLDMALEGMRVGSTYRVILPPDLAFGELGVPKVVPPNSSLAFEVYLVKAEEVNKK